MITQSGLPQPWSTNGDQDDVVERINHLEPSGHLLAPHVGRVWDGAVTSWLILLISPQRSEKYSLCVFSSCPCPFQANSNSSLDPAGQWFQTVYFYILEKKINCYQNYHVCNVSSVVPIFLKSYTDILSDLDTT